MIPNGSMVRVVDSIIDSIDRRRLYELYPGGGASAYDPVMLLKVIVFAYASGIYSSRISQATRDNGSFLWLTGLASIDSPLTRFSSERILPGFEDIFSEVIALLAEQGFITLDTYFLDGTKIEAAANKFTFVWRKSNDYYMENLRRKVHAHLQSIDEMEEAEDELAFEEPGEVDADAIREAAERINERPKFPTIYDVAGTSRPSFSKISACLTVTSPMRGRCPGCSKRSMVSIWSNRPCKV